MKKILIALLLTVLTTTQMNAQSLKPFVDGCRVALVGNSIINDGIGGDVVGQYAGKLKSP
ncbi:MAG: hypothetical protein H7223_13935 [Pedobacter sp.]|nr:hypothetical protein [Pedobacter sp.]